MIKRSEVADAIYKIILFHAVIVRGPFTDVPSSHHYKEGDRKATNSRAAVQPDCQDIVVLIEPFLLETVHIELG